VALTRDELNKLVLQEMKQNQVDEGVGDWFKQKAAGALTGIGKAATTAGEKIGGANKGKLTSQQKMERVADFIQANRNSSLVKNSALYKKLEAVDPQQLKEAYESDILKLMKQKKISDQDIDGFIKQMSANPQAKKQLMDLGISAPNESGSTEIPSQQQTQPAAGQQAQKPAAAAGTQQQPAGQEDKTQGDDGVIHVFKGKPKGPGGASLHMQLTKQFGNVPDAGKLITAISKDLLNQLKVNGLNVQESIEQVEQFLLKEVIEQKLEHNSLSYLLKENNSLDYTLTSQVFESLQEGEREKKRKEEHVRQLGFVFDNGEVNWKAFTAAVKDAKQKGEAKNDDEFIKKGLEKRKGEGEKDLAAAADVQNAKDAEQKDTEAAGQLAADTNPNPTPDVERTQSTDVPQPVAEPQQPKAEPTSGPQQSGQMIGRQQQISKAADAAFKQMTPAKAGVINVGEIVGRKLKAMAQLNRKAGLALEPMVPKMLKAIEKFIGYALAKSGKKDVKIVGGSKNAAALQKTVKQAAMGDKGAIKAGVDAMKAQQDKKQAIKEALVEEIYNLLTGKNK
jgi:hypothetical protein